MTVVTVNASKTYDIKIGKNLLSTLGSEVKSLGKAERVCIISDSNVWPLYGDICRESLINQGISVEKLIIAAGEESKNGENYLAVLEQLAKQQLSRNDLIVALGGGVVGDLAGFAAATYLRGIRYIQVPTTVLAAVDSSVGGKTAIDLGAGKNLAGAFWQPCAVLCDIDTLDTLPRDTYLDGCAEIIKYGILYDEALFSMLEETGPDFDRETVIARCVKWKRDVVAEDEFDTGARMKLNLGHTIGHGVEGCSHYSISHGKAVAIGTAMVTRASGCPDKQRILALLSRFSLPVSSDYSAEELLSYTLSDKKRSGDIINLIIPRKIGSCEIVPICVSELKSFIEEGL